MVNIRKIIREELMKSIIISDVKEYGSYEGIIHNDIEKVKNWFSNRKIDYKKYIEQIKFPTAFLNNINVNEEFRGEGYGNSLYDSFEINCFENDAKCIVLESDIGESQNEGFDLKQWYESFDFETIGVEGGNYIMLKLLD